MGAAQNNPNWLRVGDPLRGVAAFGVLLFHVAVWAAIAGSETPGATNKLGAFDFLYKLDVGVFLFFALSGYLIGRPFASAFILQTPFPSVPRFLAKRARRLVPGMAAATVLGLIVLGGRGVSLAHLAAVVGFAQLYAPSRFAHSAAIHFWTLDAEGAFYLLLPICAVVAVAVLGRVRGPRRRAAIWVAAGAAIALASVVFRSRGAALDLERQHLFPSVAFAFVPGVALAGLEPLLEPALRARPGHALLAARLVALVALAAFALYLTIPSADFMRHSLTGAAACALAVAAATVHAWGGARPWRALDNRPLQWLGERSYSLYLFHVAVVQYVAVHLVTGVRGDLARVAAIGALAIPASLVLAWAGYALVERPFMSGARRRLAGEVETEPAAALAEA